MQKTKNSRLQRVVSGLTGAVLVFQALLPLVQPGVIRPAMADPVGGEWAFDTAGDYTATGAISIANTGGYAATDLSWTAATDNMGADAGTNDVIQVTAGVSIGRIVAAISGNGITPRSDDYGATWSYHGPACGTVNGATDLTDLGAAGSNLLAGGTAAAGLALTYSNTAGNCWQDAVITGLNAGDVALTDFSSNRTGTVYASTSDAVAGQVLATADDGVNWTATAANPGPAILTTVEKAGDRIYAAGAAAVGDTESGIYYSDDAGASWTQAATTTGGNTHSIVTALRYHQGTNRVYAITNAGYVMYTSGDPLVGIPTFTKVTATNAGLATDITVSQLGAVSEVFITLSNGGIMRSVNGGTNYFTSSTTLPAGSGNKIIRMDTDVSGVADDTYLIAQVDGGAGDAYRGTFATSQTVAVNTGVPYATLTSFTETMAGSSETSAVNYQISNDGATWYYHDGADWAEASNITTHINRATVVSAAISTFDDTYTGSFYFQAIMVNGGDQLSATNSSMTLDTVTVGFTSPSITVTAPDGGEEWVKTTTRDITWTSAGLGAGNIITISYSVDNGGEWTVIDDTDNTPTANDGTYAWTLPNVTTELALVKIASGAIEDQSNAVFSIIEPGGSGGCTDNSPPISDVADLPEYQSVVPFTVSVTATDDCSGVAQVQLYYSHLALATNFSELIAYGAPKEGCPDECFEWAFNAPLGDGKYFFYSSAVDNSGKNNLDKFVDNPEGMPAEAETTLDTLRPGVDFSTPQQDEVLVPIDGDIFIRFNEFVDATTLEYGLFAITVGGSKIDATDKLGALVWEEFLYEPECPPGQSCPPELRFDRQFRVPYTALENEMDYYFVIRNLQDYAGNDLLTNYLEQPENQLVWVLHFETVEVIDPDLTQSKIEITNLPANGKFNPGDKVSFRVTLKNVSDTISLTTLTLPIATGLTYCSDVPCTPAAASSGQAPTIVTDGSEVSIVWTGDVVKGADVLVTFDVLIVSPVQDMVITQTAEIDDGLHDEIYIKSVNVEIKEVANFSTSTKTGTCLWQGVVQSCTDAVVGTEITYTITVTNTGTTPVTRTVTDALGAYLDYVSGPTGSGWTSLIYDPTANAIIGTATWAAGASKSFTFSATFTPDAAGLSVTNVANIQSWTPDPSFTTSVPGISEPQEFSPIVVEQSPTAASAGVAQNAPIIVAFSKSIDVTTFAYTLTVNGETVDTASFGRAWTDHNSNGNAKVTLTHPDQPFDLGAVYQITVSSEVADLDGNTLQEGNLPNPWSWTIANPVVIISSPTDAVVVVGVDTVSPEFVVSIVDQATGQPYTVTQTTPIGLLAEVPGTGDLGKKRQVSTTARFRATATGSFEPSTESRIFHINVLSGNSQASFHFKDSVANLVSVIAFPDPWNGWSAGDKAVLVTDEDIEDSQAKLVFDIPDTTITAGTFSKPITVMAEAADTPILLPSRVYLYTESLTGAFYDANFNKLDQYVAIQANPTTNLQFANVGGLSATFYYRDTVSQSSLITASDNAPLNPDTGMTNAMAILIILNIDDEEEDILEELEEVVDDTGRELATVEIDPTQAVLLPGGVRSFAVRAIDTEGNVIESAKFKWYVVAGGGEIEKDGINDTSHESAFTAGDELGSFYDTIVVATIYNGKFGYATASIRVSDIVEYYGPGQLPYTGISGIQIIFTILTLMAAIALAWVEHYDKTHFEKGS